jgi:hypothetical protein
VSFFRFDGPVEEFGAWIVPESIRWFNGEYVFAECTCRGEEGVACVADAGCRSLAHDVKKYARLLRAGKGKELLGEFGA